MSLLIGTGKVGTMGKQPASKKSAAAIVSMRAPHRATAKVVELAGQPFARLLYSAFTQYNDKFFGGLLGQALVLVTPPRTPRALGDYIKRDEHGLESRIRIAPNALERGELFCLDVLLHEMVHAWQEEVAEDGEDGYRGHGPKFAAACNAIGKLLGLPEVGVKGRDGKPNCAHWPMCVRPAKYYPNKYVAPTRKPKAPAEDQSESSDEIEPPSSERRMTTILTICRSFDDNELQQVHDLIGGEIERRAAQKAPRAKGAA